MDLPSMARVTKLPLDMLQEKAQLDAGLRAGPRQPGARPAPCTRPGTPRDPWPARPADVIARDAARRRARPPRRGARRPARRPRSPSRVAALDQAASWLSASRGTISSVSIRRPGRPWLGDAARPRRPAPSRAAGPTAGRPLVVRRRMPGERADGVPLGLPLPPAHGKRRIGRVACPATAVVRPRTLPRPALRAPARGPGRVACDDRGPDRILAADARRRAAACSAASPGRLLTGLDYLGARPRTSTCSGRCGPARPGRPARAAARHRSAGAPMRLDGEIV